jgi:hypothetical protein
MRSNGSVRLGWIPLALGLAIMLTSAVGVEASVLVGDTMYFGNYDFGKGGSFTAYPLQASDTAAYKTFCVQLEQQVFVNAGSGWAYSVSALGYSNDTPDTARSMTSQTAWLYASFRDGSLPGYVNDAVHEAAVQYGIWRSMGYSDCDIVNAGEDLYTARGGAKGLYYSLGWDHTPASWSGYGDVQIAVIRSARDNAMAQDVLVMSRNGSVPEPATLSLLAVAGMALLRRRR